METKINIKKLFLAVTYGGGYMPPEEQASLLHCEVQDISEALRSAKCRMINRLLARQAHAGMWYNDGMVGPNGKLP